MRSSKKYKPEETVLLITLYGFSRSPSSIDDIDALSLIDKQRLTVLTAKYVPGNTIYVSDISDIKKQEILPANIVANHLLKMFNAHIVQIHALNAFSISWEVHRKLKKCRRYKKLLLINSDFYWDAYQDIWYSLQNRGIEYVGKLDLEHNSRDVPAESQRAWRGDMIKTLVAIATMGTIGHWLAMKIADRITRKHMKFGVALDGHKILT